MIWILLIIFQFKHFIADYLFQGKYMLGKFKNTGWVLPLAAHCGVHWLFTFWIVGFSLPGNIDYNTGTILLFGLPTLDFTIHFIMDRIKASPKMLGRFEALSKKEMINLLHLETMVKVNETQLNLDLTVQKNEINDKKRSNILFWWSLGLDQLVHHLTDLLIIYLIMRFV